jgi:hypothetical protein
MLSTFASALRPAAVMTAGFALLLGGAYPALVTGLGQLAFPRQANGSLIVRGGQVVGSDLLAQGLPRPAISTRAPRLPVPMAMTRAPRPGPTLARPRKVWPTASPVTAPHSLPRITTPSRLRW